MGVEKKEGFDDSLNGGENGVGGKEKLFNISEEFRQLIGTLIVNKDENLSIYSGEKYGSTFYFDRNEKIYFVDKKGNKFNLAIGEISKMIFNRKKLMIIHYNIGKENYNFTIIDMEEGKILAENIKK